MLYRTSLRGLLGTQYICAMPMRRHARIHQELSIKYMQLVRCGLKTLPCHRGSGLKHGGDQDLWRFILRHHLPPSW